MSLAAGVQAPVTVILHSAQEETSSVLLRDEREVAPGPARPRRQNHTHGPAV